MNATGEQLAFAFGPSPDDRLFSDHFLSNRLPDWPEFEELDDSELFETLKALWQGERTGLNDANEAQTEERWIKPVLGSLGFSYTVQAGLRVAGGRRQPDYALFAGDDDRAASEGLEGVARYERAVAVADAKRFDRPLEGRAATQALSEDPVAQIIHYISFTRRPWGILTNGRLWRLYGAKGDLVSGAAYQVDLPALLEVGDARLFRYFSAFFGAAAFERDPAGRCFLDRALSESRASAVRVGEALQAQVFAAVPLVASGLLGDEERSEASLAAAFDSSLVLLYRLLFCLYAEERGLLPLANPHYRAYSLREQKEGLAADIDIGRIFSSTSDDLYNDLRGLFRIVDRGDDQLGVSEYNGGLFSAGRHPYFTNRWVPDAQLAPALDSLYRVGGDFVDYRDLSARHLGTIYERLLDFKLEDEDGELSLAPAPGRRDTGSYFTPEHVVDVIVERTLEPILSKRSAEIRERGATGAGALDAFLELRVLDPAMGSGHFLVSAAAYMARYIRTDPAYEGELTWEEIERLVAERCLYGVDVNPMAVELAQLSLWLTTVERDEPLTFLNDLRAGNSLVGVDVEELMAGGDTVFTQRVARDLDTILERTAAITSRDSDTGEAVHEKERLASAVEELRGPLETFADEQLAPSFSNGIGRFFHWEIEFPDVFLTPDGRRRPDGGFDAIIGNPPYVRIQALGRELAEYCRGRYDTASGSFDVYVPFIERSLSLLGPGGRLGFIVPNKLLKLDFAKRLRELFSSGTLIEELIDFGDAQVFQGATNYTCILVLDRGGQEDFDYRRVHGDNEDVRNALVDVDALPTEKFTTGEFGEGPWVLAAGEELDILRVCAADADPLGEVTAGIFTGLQTSADPIYIVEDRGRRGSNRLVFSRATGQELELEPDLLHPLASGGDVDRYAFRPLGDLLVFPYRRDGEEMRLLDIDELAALPLTEAYLASQEGALRGREGGRMDHDGWYAFGRTQSLGAHDSPKLGVAATVQRLEVAADLGGDIYFHNVRVNGILLKDDGPSMSALLALLNSRLLDWIFRRGAGEHANGYYAANKQFIAPLPIKMADDNQGHELDDLGTRLHERAARLGTERRGFLDWLGGEIGARPQDLRGSTLLQSYDERSLTEVLDTLRTNRARLSADVESRAFRERLADELNASLERAGEHRRALERDEAAADDLVFDLYGLTAGQRRLVDSEYTVDD